MTLFPRAVWFDSPCSVARKAESLALLRASMMQVLEIACHMSHPAIMCNTHALQLARPETPLISKERSVSNAAGTLDNVPAVDVLWTEDDSGAQQSSIYCATTQRLVRPQQLFTPQCVTLCRSISSPTLLEWGISTPKKFSC